MPDPDSVTTPQELADALARVKVHSGLGYRSIETAAAKLPPDGAGRGRTAPRSTVESMVKSGRVPSQDLLETFLTVCGIPPGQRGRWVGAWQRTRTPTAGPPGAIRVAKADPRRLGVHRALHRGDTFNRGDDAAVADWDFFISYTGVDHGWAEWIAWQLEEAGYRVLFQAWDFVPGSHWTSRMREGIEQASRTLAVLSGAYLTSVFGQAEWESAFRADPQGFARKLIPVRIEDCHRPDLLGGVVSFDLFGRSADSARRWLLDRIDATLIGRAKPSVEPAFPAAPGRDVLPTTTLTVFQAPVQPRRTSEPVFPSAPGVGDRSGSTWDVALTYDGTHQAYVEQVARILEDRGLRCFSDRATQEEIELWGRNLTEEPPAIYAVRAAVVVVFISAEYVASDWTRLEHRAAFSRAVREQREFVLPARFDDTPLPGLLSGIVTVDLRGRSARDFADMIIGKLVQLDVISPPAGAASSEKPARGGRLGRLWAVFWQPGRRRTIVLALVLGAVLLTVPFAVTPPWWAPGQPRPHSTTPVATPVRSRSRPSQASSPTPPVDALTLIAPPLNRPADVTSGADGALYIDDRASNRIWKVSKGRLITTVAGTGVAGSSGDGGPAAQAQLNHPDGIAVGADGNVYVADTGNNRVRVIDRAGSISTLAGTGAGGFYGDGGPADKAQLDHPDGLAVGPDGTIYVADASNDRVRRIGTTGLISTFAGTGVAGFSGDGAAAVRAELNLPVGVAIGPDSTVYVADTSNNRIRMINPEGVIRTVAGTGEAGFSGDGGPSDQAELSHPDRVAVGANGVVYVADTSNNRIRAIGPNGLIETVAGTGIAGRAGDGGPAHRAQLNYPDGIATGADGVIFVADTSNSQVRAISKTELISTLPR